MRWDALFHDLQSQIEAQQRLEEAAMVADLAHAEAAGTRFSDRLRARRGQEVSVRLVDGTDLSGTVVDVATEWVLLGVADRRHLIPVTAIALTWPLAGSAPEPTLVERRLGLGYVLRALAGEGQNVVLRTGGSDHTGRIVRVGGDHLDFATGTGVLTAPWPAVLCVSSR